MNVTVFPSQPQGVLTAIASKSAAHRLLICAAFADGDTVIKCESSNDDIDATVDCLNALGANIKRDGGAFRVSPIKELNKNSNLNCRESGSTLRFLLPITCFLGADASFVTAGRLGERPLSPLREELMDGGIDFFKTGTTPITCKGEVKKCDFSVAGNVSSQFITGLLLAMAISKKGGTVNIIGKLESEPYVDLTRDALSTFGVKVEKTERGYTLKEGQALVSCKTAVTEGDWSSAAFPLSMGALGKYPVTVNGISLASRQGDKQIVEILRRFGAGIDVSDNSVTVSPASLRGTEIDASQIPDLVPVIATVATVAEGQTVIYNAGRLRLKESDRLLSTSTMLNSLGASVTETDDGLIIKGRATLKGGTVSSFNDHRIAMSAAVASIVCDAPVTVEGAQAVSKSYPDFWRDVNALGIKTIDI